MKNILYSIFTVTMVSGQRGVKIQKSQLSYETTNTRPSVKTAERK